MDVHGMARNGLCFKVCQILHQAQLKEVGLKQNQETTALHYPQPFNLGRRAPHE